jgi:chromosome partitioning protein
MRSILVVNPKGGAGKTTLTTNVASYLARKGERVTIGDLDRQQSAMAWLEFRDEALPRIQGFDARDGWEKKLPKGTTALVIDAPAGIHGRKLGDSLKAADKVLVPVQPSLFDMAATEEFLRLVAEEKSVRKQKTFVALVAIRVDPRTRMAAMLERFLTHFELPVLTYLRDTQVYPSAAAEGRSLFDIAASRAKRELANWEPLTAWIDG